MMVNEGSDRRCSFGMIRVVSATFDEPILDDDKSWRLATSDACTCRKTCQKLPVPYLDQLTEPAVSVVKRHLKNHSKSLNINNFVFFSRILMGDVITDSFSIFNKEHTASTKNLFVIILRKLRGKITSDEYR